jgi:hypothetical protein
MRFENSKFNFWLWSENADDALKSVGGTLSLLQAGAYLDMPQGELRARLDERSILFFDEPEMYGEGLIAIPAFQFQGKFHIPLFHELWDILANSCRTERICQFFAHETLEKNGLCIRDLLCSKPSENELHAIRQKAEEFAEEFRRQACE